MGNRKVYYGILLFLFALAVIAGISIYHSQKSDTLSVTFLNVGQGDAILISQGSYQMLIDGGRNGKTLLNELGTYIPFWDRNIEVMVATHPDQDHIAGLIDVLRAYSVKTVIENGDTSDSKTYAAFEDGMRNEKSETIEAEKGVTIQFPGGAAAEILYPLSKTGDLPDTRSNSGSVVVKMIFGQNSFLFMGDLPSEDELALIRSGADLDSDVLKVGHHGSKYSTSTELLEAVTPRNAVISVGKDNAYGHPSGEVLNELSEKQITILRTDERGDIAYICEKDAPCLAR